MLGVDKKGFPRLEPDLDLGIIISPVKSGTGRGNSAHDSATGRFTFLPKGVQILEGENLAKGLSTATAKLFRERASALGANQASLRVINGNLHVVLLVDGKRMGSFQVEPESKRKSKDEGQEGIGNPTAELSDQEKDFIIKFARDLGLTGEELVTRLNETFTGISPPQIQQILQLVDAQRILDVVHYLDLRLRIEIKKEKISDAQVRVSVGRGFLRRSFATMDEDQIKIVVQRLQGLGWSQDELDRGITSKLPKRYKGIVNEKQSAEGKGVREGSSKKATG